MAQVPECVVCLQPFDDFRHVPRVLTCGHSFCELCLMQLQSAWQPSRQQLTTSSNGNSPGVGAVIRCPECNHRTRLPVGGQQSLPKNVELIRLLPSLIKEASTEEGADNGKKPGGGSRDVEGNGNHRVSKRPIVAENGGVRSRRRGDRRLKGKEKQSIDSNCSPGSWLVQCDLYSGNFNADFRTWVLPEKAIMLGQDSPRWLVNQSEKQFLTGIVILVEQKSNIPVTLLQLDVEGSPLKESLTYDQSVYKAWEGLADDSKTELSILFRISLLCRRLCSVLGLWMNDNKLFLVSHISTHDTVSAWETILKSCQMEELADADAESEKDANENYVPGEVSSLSAGELWERPSEATTRTLSRVGMGICEVLWEAHSQGLIFGLVSPNCLVHDQFGSLLLLDVNAALSERLAVRDSAAVLRAASLELEGRSSPFQVEAELLDSQRSRNCWQYMSPEALSLLVNDSADCGDSKAGNGSSASDRVQELLTCKADVWSLGCLLLELLSRQAPYHGLTFPEVVQKVLVEREKPGETWRNLEKPSLDDSPEDGAYSDDFQRHGHIKAFKSLLSKCFEHDPYQRPEIDALWLSLVELGSFDLFPERSITHRQLAPTSTHQKYWMLCLPGFVLDGHLDTTRKGDVEESQRRLELLRVDNGGEDDGRGLQPCGLELKGSLDGHRDYVTALVVCGDHLLSASFDRTIRVWSLEDHKLQQTLDGHSIVITALAVDHNTFRCFSGDSAGKICAWKVGEDAPDHGQPIATWDDHSDWRYTGVTSLAVSADGILYSGSGDRTIKAWFLQNFERLGTMEGHTAIVSALLVDGELLYSGSWDGTIRVWWRNDFTPVAVLGGGATAVSALGGVRTLCMSDSFLFAGRDNGAIQVWRDEECLTTVKAHDLVVSTLYVEGDFLYTGSWDQQIKAWKVDEFLSDPSPTLVKNCDSALSSIVSDGDRLYAGLADSVIKVYSLLGDTWASLVQMLNP